LAFTATFFAQEETRPRWAHQRRRRYKCTPLHWCREFSRNLFTRTTRSPQTGWQGRREGPSEVCKSLVSSSCLSMSYLGRFTFSQPRIF